MMPGSIVPYQGYGAPAYGAPGYGSIVPYSGGAYPGSYYGHGI
jgi:hypothetical protein